MSPTDKVKPPSSHTRTPAASATEELTVQRAKQVEPVPLPHPEAFLIAYLKRSDARMRKSLQAYWEDTRRNLPFTNPIIQGLEM